jgi:hypothetical protein
MIRELARHHERIAAVVPRPGKRQHSLLTAWSNMLDEQVGSLAPGSFHQFVPGRTTRYSFSLDCPHLFSRDQQGHATFSA